MPYNTHEASLLNNIHDHNMAYLMLARELLAHDFHLGMLQLGISREVAQLLLDMPIPHVVELSRANQLLCTFALDQSELVDWRDRPIQHNEVINAQRALHLINPVRPSAKHSARRTKT